jgi:hypothetical protein
MHGRTLVVISILSLLAGAVNAAPLCDKTVCWQVAPTVCLVDQQQRPCQLVLSLQWQSTLPQSVCIYLDGQKLDCWLAASEGQWRQQLQLTGPARLELRSQQQQVLLQQQLTVLSRQPERRRRLVAPWSVF